MATPRLLISFQTCKENTAMESLQRKEEYIMVCFKTYDFITNRTNLSPVGHCFSLVLLYYIPYAFIFMLLHYFTFMLLPLTLFSQYLYHVHALFQAILQHWTIGPFLLVSWLPLMSYLIFSLLLARHIFLWTSGWAFLNLLI